MLWFALCEWVAAAIGVVEISEYSIIRTHVSLTQPFISVEKALELEIELSDYAISFLTLSATPKE